MTFEIFKASLAKENSPTGIDPLLEALWHDAKGNWSEAHNIAQDITTKEGSWIHAYLHRKEGDQSNAGYWYHRAQKELPVVSLEGEWESLVKAMINKK